MTTTTLLTVTGGLLILLLIAGKINDHRTHRARAARIHTAAAKRHRRIQANRDWYALHGSLPRQPAPVEPPGRRVIRVDHGPGTVPSIYLTDDLTHHAPIRYPHPPQPTTPATYLPERLTA